MPRCHSWPQASSSFQPFRLCRTHHCTLSHPSSQQQLQVSTSHSQPTNCMKVCLTGFLLCAAIILSSLALWWLAGRNYAKYSPEGANPIKILGVSSGMLLRLRHHVSVYLNR